MTRTSRQYSFVVPEAQFLAKPTRNTWAQRTSCYAVKLDFNLLKVDRALCVSGDKIGFGTWTMLTNKQRALSEALLRVPGVQQVELTGRQLLKFHVRPYCDRTSIYAGVAAALYSVYGAVEAEELAA